MNLFEILKAKHGMLTSDLKTMLWRNNANPSEYDVTITNTPPLYLPYSLGYNLADWSITGQTVQDGTPTPENPVDVQGVGEKTGNLCSELVVGSINSSNGAFISSTSGKRSGYIKINSNKSYTISSNHYPFQNFVCFYGVDKNYLSRTTGIGLNGERSFTSPDNAEYMAVTCSRSNESQINPNDYDDFYLMINSGTTALPYEPYGYKIPVVTKGKNLFDGLYSQGGYYDSTGIAYNAVTQIRNTNVISVKPNTKYVIKLHSETQMFRAVYFYDTNNTYLNDKILWSNYPREYAFTTASDCYYLNFSVMYSDKSNILPSDADNIQLELGSTPTPYEPYTEPTTTNIYLDSPLMDGETVSNDGEREVEWGKVYLKDLSFSRVSLTNPNTSETFYAFRSIAIDKCLVTSDAYFTNSYYKGIGRQYLENYQYSKYNRTNNNQFFFRNDDYESKEDFVDSLTDEYLIYQLATPTTSTIAPTNIPTTTGTCVLDVDTSVQPSSMTVTYKSSVPDNDMADMIQLLSEI